jgi:hypothetical protein
VKTVTLYSYVVAHDFGFAPNPFHGICTLATCKPNIRKEAVQGDYVVGTGCAKRKRQGYLVYFMRLNEIITFDQYWSDGRFQMKKPNLSGSLMQAFGDNIYHSLPKGRWAQEKSVHSYESGQPNRVNVQTDTKSARVLIATDFAYFGGSGPMIPERFRGTNGNDICGKRFYRKNLPPELVASFVLWLRSLKTQGFAGEPLDWRSNWATKSFMSEGRRRAVLASRRASAKDLR